MLVNESLVFWIFNKKSNDIYGWGGMVADIHGNYMSLKSNEFAALQTMAFSKV